MAVLTIRKIDDAIMTGLRVRAAQHGCSMEEEVRRILIAAVSGGDAEEGLGTRLHRLFAGLGELEIPPRNPVRPPPTFGTRAAKSK